MIKRIMLFVALVTSSNVFSMETSNNAETSSPKKQKEINLAKRAMRYTQEGKKYFDSGDWEFEKEKNSPELKKHQEKNLDRIAGICAIGRNPSRNSSN